jgi:AbiV family abortive infection protein
VDKHLKKYWGPLSAAEIADGIAAAQANAIRLLNDAQLLFDAERFPSAAALAILSIEERGKVAILRRLALLTDEKDLKLGWREYRNHRAKNSGWIIPTLIADGARTLSALAPAIHKDAEHAWVLDALKQVAVYTDCLGERHWSIPTDAIDADVAKSMLVTADLMWCSGTVTAREIELWVGIVGPEYARPGMAAAVVKFQAALHAEGLHSRPAESLEAFMQGHPLEVAARD